MGKRFACVAQGGGFYGCAFCTADVNGGELDRTTIWLVVDGLRWPAEFHEDHIEIFLPPDTGVSISEFGGGPQEVPVVLSDTGHATHDMHALQHLQLAFRQPATTNGSIAARFVEKPGWREKAKKLFLDPEDVLRIANASDFPPRTIAD